MLILLPLLALASLACFAYPLYVIWPFRHQGARELSAALFVLRIGPWFSILCAALSIALVVYAWPRLRGWLRRSAAVICILVAAFGAALARFNIYERLMFRPIVGPQFEPANRAQLDPDDMVLALHMNGARRAYPIREIAYHHIVNDTLGGVPVVATY
jgi:glucan phosphoethanolaminetransferase (alkaline phosphatase superfamily)